MPEDRLIIDYLEGEAPVQSLGSIDGDEYYFRSRWDEWDFAVTDDPRFDPIDGIFDQLAFYREGSYGKDPYDASYMPVRIAEFIIRLCSREYLTLKRSRMIEPRALDG
jgi:hypothetical protein